MIELDLAKIDFLERCTKGILLHLKMYILTIIGKMLFNGVYS